MANQSSLEAAIDDSLMTLGLENVRARNSTSITNCDTKTQQKIVLEFSKLKKRQFQVSTRFSPDEEKLWKNGTYFLWNYNFEEIKNDHFGAENSCLERKFISGQGFETVLVGCKTKIDEVCKTKVCVPMCCGNINVYPIDINGTIGGECERPKDVKKIPWLHDEQIVELSEDDGMDQEVISDVLYAYPENDLTGNCLMNGNDEFVYTNIIPRENKTLVYHRIDGSFELALNDDFLKPTEYCVAQYEQKTQNSTTERIVKVRICKNKYWFRTMHTQIGPVLCCISMIFLIIAIIYEWINNRYKAHGAIRICLSFCALSLFFLYAIKPLFPTLVLHQPALCTFIGLTAQFMYLSIMCWVTVLSFDIWKTFSKFETKRSALSKRKTLGFCNEKFKRYALICISVPSFMTIVTTTMMFLPMNMTKNLVIPVIGTGTCLLGSVDFGYYGLLPAGLLFILPLTFCCLFAREYCCGVWYEKKDDQVVTSGMKQKARIVVRVVVLTGIIWVIDIVSGILAVTYGGQHDISLTFASAFDWISYLNGVWLSLAITVHTPCMKKTKDTIFKRVLSYDNPSKQTESTKDFTSNPMIKK